MQRQSHMHMPPAYHRRHQQGTLKLRLAGIAEFDQRRVGRIPGGSKIKPALAHPALPVGVTDRIRPIEQHMLRLQHRHFSGRVRHPPSQRWPPREQRQRRSAPLIPAILRPVIHRDQRPAIFHPAHQTIPMRQQGRTLAKPEQTNNNRREPAEVTMRQHLVIQRLG